MHTRTHTQCGLFHLALCLNWSCNCLWPVKSRGSNYNFCSLALQRSSTYSFSWLRYSAVGSQPPCCEELPLHTEALRERTKEPGWQPSWALCQPAPTAASESVILDITVTLCLQERVAPSTTTQSRAAKGDQPDTALWEIIKGHCLGLLRFGSGLLYCNKYLKYFPSLCTLSLHWDPYYSQYLEIHFQVLGT